MMVETIELARWWWTLMRGALVVLGWRLRRVHQRVTA
jgi:hypothetical protein